MLRSSAFKVLCHFGGYPLHRFHLSKEACTRTIFCCIISYKFMNQAQNEKKMESLEEIESRLHAEIRDAVSDYAEQMQVRKVKSLARHNPEKVAKILYLFSTGVSQTAMVRKYGIHRSTVVHVLMEFSDHMRQFKELGGKLAARNYINLASLEEDLIEKVRSRLEEDPEMEVSFRDLKELSIAKANAAREALTARGEVSSISEERKIYTKEDYDSMIESARARIKEAQKEKDLIVDIDEI